ncbi:hypothetical protein FH584_20385 (plasmid) [Leptospira interrogans]|uniref:hypothetical protein n=1 Tax=Leptospira interrogans TaxID=173 RepID=UPI001EF05167|nr:hypothetical protein [Leptospira interrogans]ULG94711.1 hypothetical protein FH584_20385 [Leptospira interrogans]
MNPRDFLLLLALFNASAIAQKASLISSKDAIAIVEKDSGFLGIWVTAEQKHDQWHVKSRFKSAHPPMYYIIDAKHGKILLKLDNSDDPLQKSKLERFF